MPPVPTAPPRHIPYCVTYWGSITIYLGLLQNIHITLLSSPSLKHFPRKPLFLTGVNLTCSGCLGRKKVEHPWITISPVTSSLDIIIFAWAYLSQEYTTVPKARRAHISQPDHDYRRALFYCASLYWTSQILWFLQIEGLWQPRVKQVYRRHFSNSICSLHVSVSHFGNSCNIPNFFIITTFVMVMCDQWSLMLLL